ncbi:ATP phosphoribosyltransferase [Gluconobacter oxydans]|uniref:ATP phosphoribosyltransferase n=3 Tax=Gluconobacter TaxID=441 RepID=A0AAP9ESK1_GLUTH|nr:ATP phosphoribosyltransferase catalytic subunit [Gluconobacter oxydans H24]ANQ40565.1 ATP phosphoribosyltransferase [Gluconobacter oxydans]QEH95772.1 ATP phosphoribosyltransferase [Gluconobacter thailandicus]GAC87716.1 ATP phosphoribosyltransferase [Gluconobacter thailandicus NBRC 3255]GAD26294.1 ATP phosphoribosyltransferase [Gluconobacter thailandicus NBRC 3257]
MEDRRFVICAAVLISLAADSKDRRLMTAPQTGTDTSDRSGSPMILALPKGRILKALAPVLKRTGIEPDADCLEESSRRLRFGTSYPNLDVVRVRSFDVATFVAYGGAHIGVCGADVLMEFDYPDIYAPLDLGIGGCRISVARPKNVTEDPAASQSRLRVATKYPTIARRHFASRAINAEIVHLNGAMELAPTLDLASVIVDLVDTGSTLRANGLMETETIANVTSRLIVNRVALKTRPEEIGLLIERFRAALSEEAAAK